MHVETWKIETCISNQLLKRQPLPYRILQWYNETGLLYTAVIKTIAKIT